VPSWSTPSAQGFNPATPSIPPSREQPRAHTLTELGNAEALVDLHASGLIHVKERRRWHVWNGGRWRPDLTGEVERRAKDVARELLRRSSEETDHDERVRLAKWALQSSTDRGVRAMLNLASTEPEVVLPADALDRDPFLLACANGTLDLRTGELREAAPDDLITLGTDVTYDIDAGCPRWLEFLHEVFNGDEDLIAFLKRAIGYSLTGDTREHVLFVLHGAGANGKTTLVEMVQRLAGDFAQTTPFDTFVRVRGGHGTRNDLARLHQARVAIAAESGEDRRLDEATVKLVTGGDTIAARFLYGEFFDYQPRFKVWLVTNHRPRVDVKTTRSGGAYVSFHSRSRSEGAKTAG
jgi:putative DNA primase/helicase